MSSYLFALVDGGGTVPPETGVARRLVQRGHRVTVLAEESMRDEVRATGTTLVPWTRGPNRPDRRPEHDPLRDWEIRTPRQLITRMLDGVLAGPAPGCAADVIAPIAKNEQTTRSGRRSRTAAITSAAHPGAGPARTPSSMRVIS